MSEVAKPRYVYYELAYVVAGETRYSMTYDDQVTAEKEYRKFIPQQGEKQLWEISGNTLAELVSKQLRVIKLLHSKAAAPSSVLSDS